MSLLRYRADVRTLAWAAAMPVVVLAQYANPALVPYLAPVAFYLALAAGVIAHNHNHCPTFKNKKLNSGFGIWLSIFYGYPTFAWIPTHNLNHHKFVNKAGDATITWRYTKKHNWFVASTYFFVSSYWQSGPINAYIRKARESNPRMFRQIVTQYVIFWGVHAAMLGLAMALRGPLGGLWLWGITMGLPAFFALWTIMLFNYIQHIHADPWSEHNHSRSFTGKLLNVLLFNNGLHAAHHENAGAHWSKLPEIHAKIVDKIHPDLLHRSFWWFVVKSYVLALAFPSLGTKQVGRAAYDVPFDPTLATGEVEAVEAGVNAAMV